MRTPKFLGGAGRPKKGNRVAKAVFSNLPWHQENSRHPTTQEQVESLHMAQLRKRNSFSPPVPRNLNGNMFIETSSNLFEKNQPFPRNMFSLNNFPYGLDSGHGGTEESFVVATLHQDSFLGTSSASNSTHVNLWF